VGGGSSSVLKTNAKTPANLAGTVTNANQWITVTWDLETEVPAAQAAQWPALLSIQTRFAVNANQVVGFQFRNPMLRLKATGRNLAVSGLKIFVNDEEQNLITTFLGFRTVVAVTTDFPLVPGTSAGIGWRPDSVATDQVAIEIQNIEFTTDSATVHNPGGGNPGNGLPLPTSITYAQLTSTDPDLGIFRNECFMCHSGANPSASLNLSDAAQTRLQSNLDLIRLRAVTQGNMPMRGLSQRQKDILNLWLNTGAPL
jgi:hypothetical protein